MSTGSTAAPENIGYMVKAAQHLIRQRLDAALAQCGLSTAQYALMSAIEGTETLSGADLARRCFITPQSVNSLLSTLEKEGLIKRTASRSHGRVIETALTASGQARLAEAHKHAMVLETLMLADMSTEERALLASLLNRIIHSLE